jgi:hypothetical protein
MPAPSETRLSRVPIFAPTAARLTWMFDVGGATHRLKVRWRDRSRSGRLTGGRKWEAMAYTYGGRSLG